MNKIIFLTLALILVACTPQVTASQTSEVSKTSEVLTATPIPTPTLHPEFMAWQELISSSARYTLTPDGFIQENGIAIAGLQVDANGILTLTVNNEKIMLTVNDVTFNEDGIQIKGYELNENGEWVETVSEAMQTLNTDFEKYILSPENFTIDEQGENLEVTDPETGEIVYKNGSFDPMFLGSRIKSLGMCKKTEWTGAQEGPALPKDLQGYTEEYGQPLVDYYLLLVKNRAITNSGSRLQDYYLGTGCWATIFFKSENQQDAMYFWKDNLGKVKYQQVFLSSKE